MVIKAAKVPDSACWRETPARTFPIPVLPAGPSMLQQLGADVGDTGTLPSPDRLAAAALARDVLPALTLSLLFLTPSLYIMCAAEIFAPVFLHPSENCVDFFLASCFTSAVPWKMPLGRLFGGSSAHRGQGCGLTSSLRLYSGGDTGDTVFKGQLPRR